jgi:hypothetical protein
MDSNWGGDLMKILGTLFVILSVLALLGLWKLGEILFWLVGKFL